MMPFEELVVCSGTEEQLLKTGDDTVHHLVAENFEMASGSFGSKLASMMASSE